MDLINKTNLSYYTVPVAFVLCFLPHSIGTILAGKNYDPANPRRVEEYVAKDQSIDKATRNRISRAKAAAANGLETIGIYSAAVVAGNITHIPVKTLNVLALSYIATRAFYVFAYVVLQDNRKMAPLRSLSWATGIGLIMTLFIKAGNAA